MSVRAYVPCSLALLAVAVRTGELSPGPAHAVTEALRAADPDGGDEDWEYAALTAAAQESVGLLVGADRPARLVVVAEVPALTEGGPELTSARLVGPVPLTEVAAVHVDTGQAAEVVAAARDAWAAARAGDEVALDVVERCTDHDLAWFAAQEIERLLGADLG